VSIATRTDLGSQLALIDEPSDVPELRTARVAYAPGAGSCRPDQIVSALP
jgi:hypothetical protein